MNRQLPASVTTLLSDLRKGLGHRELTDPTFKAFDQFLDRLTGWLCDRESDIAGRATILAGLLDSEGLGELATRVREVPTELAA